MLVIVLLVVSSSGSSSSSNNNNSSDHNSCQVYVCGDVLRWRAYTCQQRMLYNIPHLDGPDQYKCTYVRMYVCMNSMPIISAVKIVISELRGTYLSSEQEMKVQTCALMPWASHGPQDGSAVIAWVTPREWSHMVAF